MGTIPPVRRRREIMMVAEMRNGDLITASTVIAASPDQVYAVISDITRIPQWSPECVHAEWLDDTRFRGTNRRGLGRWSTTATVVTADPGREFSFVVEMMGADFTRWTYRMQPDPRGCLLTEEFAMCRDLPLTAVLFERLALRVRDRRSDLQGNLDQSLRRLRQIIEVNHSES